MPIFVSNQRLLASLGCPEGSASRAQALETEETGPAKCNLVQKPEGTAGIAFLEHVNRNIVRSPVPGKEVVPHSYHQR